MRNQLAILSDNDKVVKLQFIPTREFDSGYCEDCGNFTYELHHDEIGHVVCAACARWSRIPHHLRRLLHENYGKHAKGNLAEIIPL